MYEPHIIALQHIEGFCKQFWLFCGEYGTQEKAYEATERMYEKYYGRTRYGSFESFKTLKNRWLRDGCK